MNFKSVKEILTAIKNKDVSVIELTSNYLDKIKERDDELNCFVTLTEEFALNKARKIDEEIAKNKVRALSGLPIAQKDIFCTKNIKTSCGSKMLDNFVSPYNATVIEKLNNAGTIMLGKQIWMICNGFSNETSFYGPVKIHGILNMSLADLLVGLHLRLQPEFRHVRQEQTLADQSDSLHHFVESVD